MLTLNEYTSVRKCTTLDIEIFMTEHYYQTMPNPKYYNNWISLTMQNISQT